MPWPYANIYPQYAHDPSCRCCHPNDRPYCPCACHTTHDSHLAAPPPTLAPPISMTERRAGEREREQRRLAQLPGRRAR